MNTNQTQQDKTPVTLPEFPFWWGPSTWIEQLAAHPEYAPACPWHLFNAAEWVELLKEQPQFVDNCDWNMLDGYE